MAKKTRGKLGRELVPVAAAAVALPDDHHHPPAIVAAAGRAAAFAYAEFFGAAIANPHTYRAYRYAVDTFLAWCTARGVALQQVSPALLGDYIHTHLAGSKPTKKLH